MPTRRELILSAAWAAARPQVRLTDTKGEKIAATCNGTTLFEYRYSADRPKSYIHPLCLPGGQPITLDGPKDHVHHRGLMVAWSEVNGIDFWGETNPARHGPIAHQKFERVRDGARGEIRALLHWTAEGRLHLVERRTILVPPPGDDGVWLEWITELEAASGPVKLAAGQHVYNGLGIRFIHEWDGHSVLNSNGTATIDKANGEPAKWCAYHAPGGGVAIFDHPTNPRHPSPFFVMNKAFGYLSAAPSFKEGAFELAAKQKIRFRWGVLTFRGAPQPDALNRRFEAFGREK